jgi:V8-like Glu-specific endopeptidase
VDERFRMKAGLFFFFLIGPIQSARSEPVNWADYNDTVMLTITRPKGHPIGNTICTAVVVSPHLVLTTAHCVSDATEVRITFDVENGAKAKHVQNAKPGSWMMHPLYDPKKSYFLYDLARIRLGKPAPLAQASIRTIPDKLEIPAGTRIKRIGVGLRNGINSRNFTDPKLLSIQNKLTLETEDAFSASGDSGGPIYSTELLLIGIHSTRDDRDHKEAERGYGPYLPAYKEWIFSK